MSSNILSRNVKRLIVAYTLSSIAMLCSAATPSDGAPLFQAARWGKLPVSDPQGRISYIVDLRRDARLAYPDAEDRQEVGRFHHRHLPQFINMIVAFEKRYGFESREQTSWVGDSFVATLTPEQLRALRADPAVTMITEETYMELSAPPPWSDTTYPSSAWPYWETSSWGRVATNGKQSNGTSRVYIIDAGVGYHSDLSSVALRVNAGCGSPGTQGCPLISPVGCYPHATHVAGIIGATYGNFGVAGVLAGVPMYSVAIPFSTWTGGGKSCGSPLVVSGTVGSAMDYVKWHVIFSGTYKVAIVNLSMNGPEYKTPGSCVPGDGISCGTYNAKIIDLITPSVAIGGLIYPGAFVAQSAGNTFIDACERAFNYGPPTYISNADGIMVVGGIDSTGAAVTPTNGGFPNTLTSSEAGSNWGQCVEVWAPSKNIVSTYGPLFLFDTGNPTTWQDESTLYGQYGVMSGTSMAAPHIAAVAAYLSEYTSFANPGAVETAVRSYFQWYGGTDFSGRPVRIVQLP